MKILLAAGALILSFSACAASYKIDIPTDSKASYTVLEKGTQGNMRTIVTKREGSSGVSYSERVYDCNANEVKYLGTGDSLEQMKKSNPDPNMSPIINQSIAYYVGKEACK